jgi:hypothetical protein
MAIGRAIWANSLMIIITVVACPAVSFGSDSPDIIISENQATYLIGEPVKITVDIKNNTNTILRIPEVSLFGHQMEFMYLEVEYPDGIKEQRKFEYEQVYSIVNTKYRGEPLKPGQYVRTFLYPNFTHLLDDPTSWQRTFRVGGVHRLAVVYYIPSNLESLSASPDRKTASNIIQLIFQEPTMVEEEILECLWEDGGWSLTLGDNEIHTLLSINSLSSVLAEYEGHPLTKYVMLALGKALLGTYSLPEQRQATTLFEKLNREYPRFRPEEIMQWKATGYYYTGRIDKANQIFNAALRAYPSARHSVPFMRYKILAEYNDIKYIDKWMISRQKGDDWYVRFKEE